MTFLVKSTPDTILLKGNEHVEYVEADAGGAITPGHLIQRDSNDNFVVNSGTGLHGQKMFARENEYEGKEISTAYALNDRCFGFVAKPGAVVYAWLDAGENAVIGSKLMSNANGTLAVQTGTLEIVGVALEALNLTASAAVATRIKIEIT